MDPVCNFWIKLMCSFGGRSAFPCQTASVQPLKKSHKFVRIPESQADLQLSHRFAKDSETQREMRDYE